METFTEGFSAFLLTHSVAVNIALGIVALIAIIIGVALQIKRPEACNSHDLFDASMDSSAVGMTRDGQYLHDDGNHFPHA